MTLTIVRRPAGADCASVLAELPEWFGAPAANAAYAEAAERGPAWVAEDAEEVVGVLVLRDTGFSAMEVHLLAVRPHLHRQGVGRSLIQQARSFAGPRQGASGCSRFGEPARAVTVRPQVGPA